MRFCKLLANRYIICCFSGDYKPIKYKRMRRLTETSFFKKASETPTQEEVSEFELQTLFDEFAVHVVSVADTQESRKIILRILNYTSIRLQALLERTNRAGKKCANPYRLSIIGN